MQSNLDSIGYSSGFSTPGDKSTRQEYELDTVHLSDTLKYEEEITRLKSELDEKNRSNEKLKREKEDVCKENENLKKQLTEHSSPVDGAKCRNCVTLAIYKEKLENMKREIVELLAEKGRVEVERDMVVNQEKKEAKFKRIFSKSKNAEGLVAVIDPTSKECHVLRSDNVCSAPTEWQMDALKAIKCDVVIVDDDSLGPTQNETYSDHLHNENISPQQGEVSSDKASRTPSFAPESGTFDEETRRSLETRQDNSFQEQEQQEQNDMESNEMNINNNEPNLTYHKLLKIITPKLLQGDVSKLREWARGKYSIDSSAASAAEILTRLDQGVSNASKLGELSSFFERIGRFDLVHTIDLFLEGDY